MNYRNIISRRAKPWRSLISTLIALCVGYTPATLAMEPRKISEQDNQEKLSTLLFDAVKKGLHAKVVNLINNGADVNAMDGDQQSLLYFACLKNHVEIAKLLIEKGAIIEAVTKKGYTPLKIACYKGNIGIVQLLLKNGADIGPLINTPSTPIFLALQQNHGKIVQLLREKGAFNNIIKTQNPQSILDQRLLKHVLMEP